MHLTLSDLSKRLVLEGFEDPIALAVSGGGDSMALLLSVIDAVKTQHKLKNIYVLTVDHGLRHSAAQEIAYVKDLCTENGLQHHVLGVTGGVGQSSNAEMARVFRQNLLIKFCQSKGIKTLLIGHTRDDVVETLVMRAKRGGFRGHSSIPNVSFMKGVKIFRPFHDLERRPLRALLDSQNQTFFNDPTNDNLSHERPRVRLLVESLENEGLNRTLIANHAAVMARWRAVIANTIADLIANHCKFDEDTATVKVEGTKLHNYPRLIVTELLRELVRFIGGEEYLVSPNQFRKIREALNEQKSTRCSAGRCVVAIKNNGEMMVSRALRHLPEEMILNVGDHHWDGRYGISCQTSCSVIADGAIPILQSRAAHVKFRPIVLDGPIGWYDMPITEAFEQMIEKRADSSSNLP